MKLRPYFRGRMLAVQYAICGIPKSILEMKISDLDIDLRCAQRIECMTEIKSVGQIIEMTESKLLKYPNLGRFHTNRLKEALALHGLRLKPGPPIPVPPIPARF